MLLTGIYLTFTAAALLARAQAIYEILQSNFLCLPVVNFFDDLFTLGHSNTIINPLESLVEIFGHFSGILICECEDQRCWFLVL